MHENFLREREGAGKITKKSCGSGGEGEERSKYRAGAGGAGKILLPPAPAGARGGTRRGKFRTLAQSISFLITRLSNALDRLNAGI